MHSSDESADEGRPLFSNRAADIVVAVLLLVVCAIVIQDSNRIGFHWIEGEGPAPGYFPFYIALVLGVSSFINLVSAIRAPGSSCPRRLLISSTSMMPCWLLPALDALGSTWPPT